MAKSGAIAAPLFVWFLPESLRSHGEGAERGSRSRRRAQSAAGDVHCVPLLVVGYSQSLDAERGQQRRSFAAAVMSRQARQGLSLVARRVQFQRI